MPPNSRGLGSHGYYGMGANPVLAISGFRPKEKYLIFLVLITFLFVCFSAVFFLPDKLVDEKGGHGNRVYRVYKGLQDAGRDFILPAPPVATAIPIGKIGTGKDPESVLELNPNVRHGVHGGLDKHKIEDKSRLLAQIELDEQIKILRQKQQQQVLPKPNIIKANSPKNEEPIVIKAEEKVIKTKYDSADPLIINGEDPEVADKRNHVKGVSKYYIKYQSNF